MRSGVRANLETLSAKNPDLIPRQPARLLRVFDVPVPPGDKIRSDVLTDYEEGGRQSQFAQDRRRDVAVASISVVEGDCQPARDRFFPFQTRHEVRERYYVKILAKESAKSFE